MKQPINVSEVQSRSGLSRNDALKCAKLAEQAFSKASKLEPKITSDVVSAVSKTGSVMYGLEHRLKQPTSMAGKIGSDAKDDGVSFTAAKENLKDTIRYTAVLKDKSFAKDYNAIKGQLETSGYSEARCKNFYQSFKDGQAMHKAVQCVYTDKNGYPFELQFHTVSSQAAKELKVPIYEERRKQGISEQRARELENQMMALAYKVKDPAGVYSIKTHK